MFIHDPLPFEEISAETTAHGRVYNTPGGRFQSVTTVISASKDTKYLDAWKKRIGEDAARKITHQAGVRGTAVHELCEKYLLNDPEWTKGAMPVNLDTFLSIKKYIDRYLGVIRAIEMPLWSSRLRTAGRVDLIAEFDGELSIIDFKTSRKIKDDEKCFGYFVQETCYALMLYERRNILPKQIVTIMAVDGEHPLLFVKKRRDYDHHVRDIFVTRRQGLISA